MLVVNLIVFAGVGVSMTDVFRRVMLRLEPRRQFAPLWWLGIVSVIGDGVVLLLWVISVWAIDARRGANPGRAGADGGLIFETSEQILRKGIVMNAAEYVTRVRGRQRCGESGSSYQEITLTPVDASRLAEPNNEVVAVDAQQLNTLGLVELLLKNRRGLHRVLRDETTHAVLLPRLLAIALVGFVLFGVTMSLVLTVSSRWPALTAIATWIDAPTSRLFGFDPITSSAGKLAPVD